MRIARPGVRHVFLRDMVLMARIGVHEREHEAPQRVRINLDLGVTEEGDAGEDLARVLDYEQLAIAVRGIVAAGHIRLVETLAEQIATSCLVDQRVQSARVRVEKLDVFPDCTAAGVEIERQQPAGGREDCPRP